MGFESNCETMMVPIPVAVAVVLPGVQSPSPPVEALAVPVGLVLVLLPVLVTVAPKICDEECLWIGETASIGIEDLHFECAWCS